MTSEVKVGKDVSARLGDDCKTMNESSENLCVVCFKNVEIFSIGECDHPVCYECSTRMRVLCEQNECPICRQSLSKVTFTDEKRTYRELEANNRSEYYNKKYKICFANLQIQKSFYDLLDHPCPICESKSFYNFAALKDHVRKEHELFYCDICVEHLKIFSFERKCYNRQELALHRRKGDPDNTSHRGHPLCQYCSIRYLDRDELFRHLRREHFFCHFCDADGSNQFYADYDSLCDHFRSEHYLCEEGDCATEQFTAAFRTEIDLKAHIANVHSKSLGKQQAKQARTLQLEITLGPRNNRSGTSHQQDFPPIANYRSHRNEESNSNSGRNETPHSIIGGYLNQNPTKIIDASNDQEFPSLGGASGMNATSTGVTLIHPNMSIRARAFGPANIIQSKDEFPALGSSGSGSSNGGGGDADGYDPGPNINQNSKYNNIVSATLKSKNTPRQATKSTNPGGSSMVIHVSNRPNTSTSISSSANNHHHSNNNNNNITVTAPRKLPSQKDFPALPGTTNNSSNVNSNNNYVIPTMSSNVTLINNSAVPAKYRSLMNDYVSVAHPSLSSKITLVQKELIETSLSQSSSKKKPTNDSINNSTNAFVPSLKNSDFPALSIPNHNNQPITMSWVKSQKQQDIENRKSKIAPAPILNNGSLTTSKKQQMQQSNNQNNNNNIKEKKDKQTSATKSNEKNNKKSTENNGATDKQLSIKDNKSNCENKINNKNINKKDKMAATSITAAKVSENCNSKQNDGTVNERFDDNEHHQITKTKTTTTNVKNSLPPPGFDKITANCSNNSNSNNTSVKPPPPGFKTVTLNSVAKSPNNLTFTTSLGEIFSIFPNHQYIPPPNSVKRNQELVTHFQNTLNFSEAFEEFKYISQKFREGSYKALPYYEHCQAALKDKFDELFPELLVLLPDINKQQELYLVHCQHMKEKNKNQKKIQQQIKLEVCPTCKQVLKFFDKEAHVKAHSLENNFPALNGIGSGNTYNNHSLKIKK